MPPKNKKKKSKKAKTPEQKAEAEAKRAQAGRAANLASAREPTPRELAEEAKERGNAALGAGDFGAAVAHYTQAITHDHANHVYWSNRSAALLKQGDAKGAVSDGEMCIEVSPTWAKGYSRLGAALFASGDIAAAQKAYKQGLEYANATRPWTLRSPLSTRTHARSCTVMNANFDEPMGVATHWRWAWLMRSVQPPTHSECCSAASCPTLMLTHYQCISSISVTLVPRARCAGLTAAPVAVHVGSTRRIRLCWTGWSRRSRS